MKGRILIARGSRKSTIIKSARGRLLQRAVEDVGYEKRAMEKSRGENRGYRGKGGGLCEKLRGRRGLVIQKICK